MTTFSLLHGDCREVLKTLPDGSVQCCVTSPPYWGLRDYGVEAQIGLERTPEAYVAALVEVFREVRRVLSDDGVVWLNLGDSYATGGGSVRHAPGGGDQGERFVRAGMIGTQPNRMKLDGFKPKDLIGIPWRVAFALQADGWWLRSDVIWSKPNPMPESVTDRPTKAHEYVFLLAKSERYYYDAQAIAEPSTHAATRNRRTVWRVPTQPYPGSHFAVMPEALAEPCILAGSRPGDTVLDPFNGAGTTGVVAAKHGRHYIGIDANADYLTMSGRRIKAVSPLFVEEAVF